MLYFKMLAMNHTKENKRYTRKTKDVHLILANYGEGFEPVEERETLKEVKELIKDYRNNAPAYKYMLSKKRIPN